MMWPLGFTSSFVTSDIIFMKCSSDRGQSWLQGGPLLAPTGPKENRVIGELKKILAKVNLLSLRGSSCTSCAAHATIMLSASITRPAATIDFRLTIEPSLAFQS